MHTPSYVHLNGFGVYYFRIAIPQQLKALIGKHEIRRSLKTTNYTFAVKKARRLATMILDYLIVRGHPADTTQYGPLLVRQQKLYNRMPRQVSADGGFASKDNLAFAKQHKGQGCGVCQETGPVGARHGQECLGVQGALRNFRAGIEAGISTLKRAFGLDRCTWKGWEGFGRYVWSSIVSYNLLVLARTKLAAA